MQAQRKARRNWSRYDHLIEETIGILNCLHEWKVNHIRQNRNGMAYCLAKEALSISEEHGLIKEFSQCISNSIFVERCA